MFRSLLFSTVLVALMVCHPLMSQTTQPAVPQPAVYKTILDTVPLNDAEKKLLLNILVEKRQKLDAYSRETKTKRTQLHEAYKSAVAAKDYTKARQINQSLGKMALRTTNLNRNYDRMIDQLMGHGRALRWNSKILRDNCKDLIGTRRLSSAQQTQLSNLFVDYAGRFIAMRKKPAKAAVEDQILLAQLRNQVRTVLGK